MRNKMRDAVSHDMPSTPRETSDWTDNCDNEKVKGKANGLLFL